MQDNVSNPHLSESIQCELVEGGVLQLLQHRGQDVVQGPGSHLNIILYYILGIVLTVLCSESKVLAAAFRTCENIV